MKSAYNVLTFNYDKAHDHAETGAKDEQHEEKHGCRARDHTDRHYSREDRILNEEVGCYMPSVLKLVLFDILVGKSGKIYFALMAAGIRIRVSAAKSGKRSK